MKVVLDKFLSAAERLLRFLANYDRRDRIKRPILFLVGLTRWGRGLKREAMAYINHTGVMRFSRDKFMTPYEGATYYEMLEDANYKEYLNSSRELVLFASPGKDDPICDIGCGRGFLVKSLRDAGYSGCIGIENSRWAVENRVVPEVHLKSPDDFGPEAFRTVSLISVLEHSPKEEAGEFVAKVARIASDRVVCCIPLYPENLFSFFMHGADHLTFERREWWDALFAKAGFLPAYLPPRPLPFILPFVYRRARKDFDGIWSASRRNLVRTRMGMGDEICLLPVLAEARRRLPGARLVLSEDSGHLDLFQDDPSLDAVGVRAEPGDNIVEFHYQTDYSLHMSDDFAAQAGLSPLRDRTPRIYLSEADRVDIGEKRGLRVAVDTRANWATRKWPHAGFEKVASWLKEEAGAEVIEVGRTQSGWGVPPGAEALTAADLSFVDKLSLRQTASVISQCDYFLGNDSGLAHLSAAVGVKSFVIFGPVDWRLRAHRDLTIPVYREGCDPCFRGQTGEALREIATRCPKGHGGCISGIAPDQVIEAIKGELRASGPKR